MTVNLALGYSSLIRALAFFEYGHQVFEKMTTWPLATAFCGSLVSGERAVLTLAVTHVDDFFGSGHWFQGNMMTREMRNSMAGMS